ncbi:MAG: DUF5320 domain-containing protein [ANME-2 cluster archaeon]|jgi:hypothetical protein|nr:DUF5320 domain-containing protein [ANME-2 cluster archaeon]
MRGGRRNMYYATGMPGWMRLGYSPGWVGRSHGGLPPTVQYLRTGTWQTRLPQAQWQGMQTGIPAMPEQQEISMLESQAAMLEQQLEQIRKKFEELKK